MTSILAVAIIIMADSGGNSSCSQIGATLTGPPYLCRYGLGWTAVGLLWGRCVAVWAAELGQATDRTMCVCLSFQVERRTGHCRERPELPTTSWHGYFTQDRISCLAQWNM